MGTIGMFKLFRLAALPSVRVPSEWKAQYNSMRKESVIHLIGALFPLLGTSV